MTQLLGNCVSHLDAAGAVACTARVRKIRTVVSFSVTVSSVMFDRPTKSISVFIFERSIASPMLKVRRRYAGRSSVGFHPDYISAERDGVRRSFDGAGFRDADRR